MVPDFVTEPPRHNAQRARTACTFMWAMLVLSLLMIFVNYMLVEIKDRDPQDSSVVAMAIGFGLVALIYLAVYILTIIFFIMWFRRAYYNLQKFGPPYPDHSEGWASGAWFVPFLNLIRPVQIMREIWDLTPNALREPSARKELPGGGMISFWWATWLIGNIAANIASRIDEFGSNASAIFILQVISGISHVMAAYLLIQIIRTISIEEEALAERVRVVTLQRQSEWMHAQQAQTAQNNSHNAQNMAAETPSPVSPPTNTPPASDEWRPPQQ
jgi:hypothetical protein